MPLAKHKPLPLLGQFLLNVHCQIPAEPEKESNPSPRCHCGQRITDLTKEDEKTARAVCLSGHSFYVFLKDDGTLETQWQRQQRMERVYFCEDCKEEFKVAAPTGAGERRFCDSCGDRHSEEGRNRPPKKGYVVRNNDRSPWRARFRAAPEGAWKRDAMNPR